MSDSFDVRPADYSDAGNANVFQAYYYGLLAYTDALGWLCFNGAKWEASEHKAVGKATELTEEMLRDSGAELSLALHQEADAKAAVAQKLEGAAEELEQAKARVGKARAYFQHAVRSRNPLPTSARCWRYPPPAKAPLSVSKSAAPGGCQSIINVCQGP